MTQILYLPVVRRKFDADTAEQIMQQTKKQLAEYNLVAPDAALGDPTELSSYLSSVRNQHFAGIIFHNTTFTDAEFIKLVHEWYPTTPILLLAPHEPSVGGWLRLNALTGIMSSGNYLASQHHQFDHIYGNPDEPAVHDEITRFVKAVQVKDELASLNIGVVGTYPPGFFFSDANAAQLKAHFGTNLIHYNIDDAFDRAYALKPADYSDQLDYAKAHFTGLDAQGDETIRFVKFATLMRQYQKADNLGALASRCWPDFFDKYHSAPGAVWSQLCDQQLPTAMECDIHGALSMYILQEMTANRDAIFLGDFSSMDPSDNTMTTWHDYGAYSLANPKYGVEASVHPNRKVPVSPNMALKPGQVTFLRVHYNELDGYSLAVTTGNVLDAEPQFNGASGRVQMDSPVEALVDQFVEAGYESHFAVAYGDYVADLKELGRLLGLTVNVY
ncbi:hypothetical protein FD04_GL000451 [Secundilactobacillus odoratitofui DSM 19909 = JCM 15043]|uniref:L-fucose isomerase C-terminal domain-containing protein n=2 Tax=Secundilactobacillus odoratitofui TaxID=480930 RepID=A0A0R1LSH0_9LACO|nr:hypothetical protein [Secundilactobacillus odoratitofui]KRK98715.1 hypothetical protein FD04_GL000451 [Secundilactobacillus odoratitofui DSM 19909 = JCM 15043]